MPYQCSRYHLPINFFINDLLKLIIFEILYNYLGLKFENLDEVQTQIKSSLSN